MSKKLFTPGPMNVPQNIRIQLAKDIPHHRSQDFHTLFYQVRSKLKDVFQTKDEVIILTSSGTGAMESAVVNLFDKGDRVLVINTGFFGQRFIDLCELYGLRVLHLDYPWGTTYRLSDVKAAMDDNPDIKGVFVTYHETSTGVLNDLKPLGELVHQTDALLIVDAISGLIVHPFSFDEWRIDCALSSSQKGFGLPPGLSFVALSQKALDRMERTSLPAYYFKYQTYLQYAKKGETPFTPAISLFVSLDLALTEILERGITQIVSEKERLRRYTEDQFQALGFQLFVKDPAIRGNALVPVLPKAEWAFNLVKLTDHLDERHNLQVSRGQGPYAERMLRIGLLSAFTTEDVDELVTRISEFLPSQS